MAKFHAPKVPESLKSLVDDLIALDDDFFTLLASICHHQTSACMLKFVDKDEKTLKVTDRRVFKTFVQPDEIAGELKKELNKLGGKFNTYNRLPSSPIGYDLAWTVFCVSAQLHGGRSLVEHLKEFVKSRIDMPYKLRAIEDLERSDEIVRKLLSEPTAKEIVGNSPNPHSSDEPRSPHLEDTEAAIGDQSQLTLVLGNRNTYVHVLDGDGVLEIDPDKIFCRLNQEPVMPPDELVEDIAKIAEEAESNPDVWNGKTIHVKDFTVTRSKDSEYPKIHLDLQVGQYFHHMAVNSKLFREYRTLGMGGPFRERITGDFDAWRTQAFTCGINVLYVGLFVLTRDDKVIFAKRSKKAGIDPGVICCTVNENMHPDKDIDHVNAGMLSVNRLLERSLPEELGWKSTDHGKRHDTKLLVFNLNLGGITYGLMGYTKLPILYSEFLKMFAANAKDRMEVEGFIYVDWKLRELCDFVHHNDLYDHTGMGVFYLLRNRGYTTREIDDYFLKLQEDSQPR